MLERLRAKHPAFKGDWSHLERLVRILEADESRPELKPKERLAEWNDWLQGARGHDAIVHLEGANLYAAYLEGANLRGAHLEGAYLVAACLVGANLCGAHLEGAYLSDARLEGTDLIGAHLEGAHLVRADLEGARLADAHLEGAYAGLACLEGADLCGAHLEGANLGYAYLEGAILNEAVLDQADVRSARALRFDGNSVFRVRIEGDAKDAWSVLRRKYTGPWFFVHLLLLVAFFTPYAAKFLYLSALSRAQDYGVERARGLESQFKDFEHQLAEIAEKHEHTDPWLPRLTQAVSKLRQTASATLQDDLNSRFIHKRAVWVLVGWAEGWWAFVMASIVVMYNLCRGILTLRVSALRDAEERSQVTPMHKEYWPLYRIHRVAKWLLFAALSVTAANIGYWVWTTRVYVSTNASQPPAASQPAAQRGEAVAQHPAEAVLAVPNWRTQTDRRFGCVSRGISARDTDGGIM